jgi:hypothetical protein
MNIIERVKRMLSRMPAASKPEPSIEKQPDEDDSVIAGWFADYRGKRLDYLKSIGDTETMRKEGFM